MPLPSQSARPISRRSHMHRRSGRRQGRRWVVGVVGLVTVGLVTWWMWPGATTTDDAPPPPAAVVTGVETVDGGAGPLATHERDGDFAKEIDAPVTRPVTLEPPAPKEAAAPREEVVVAPPAKELVPKIDPVPEPTTAKIDSRSGREIRRQPASSRSPLPRVQEGLDLIEEDRLVEARRVLTDVLLSGTLDDTESARVRERIAEVNEELVFSPSVREGDHFSIEYRVQSNDALSRIPKKMGLAIDWRLLQIVNRIKDPKRIRLDQRIKLITGPFHAVVHKYAYRMDIYMGEPGDLVYVRSFNVGLGEFNSTPEGRFVVRKDSKLVNPEWRNPRTRELYSPDDPANPIGEHWIGLQGDEPHLMGITGYGIHGTVEPESIGKQASMGCVRMLPHDVELVYGMLLEGSSTIEIRK